MAETLAAGQQAAPRQHPQFTERQPWEKGFAAVFAREIAPHLAELEAERLAQRRQFLRRLAIFGGGGAVLMVAGLLLIEVQSVTGLAFGAFFLSGIVFLITLRPAPVTERLREVVMGPVCRFFGDLSYSRTMADTEDLDRFTDAGVVGRANRRVLQDRFVGRYRDTRFIMFEARLRNRSGKHSKTVFHGLLSMFEVPQPFTGRVLIARDHGAFGNAVTGWFRQFAGLQRLTLHHPDFESLYEVYTDNPATVRTLLSPGFCDTMTAIVDSGGGRQVRAAFTDGAFLLALPLRRPLFELGSLWRPVHDIEENLHGLLRDITIAYRLIDYLHGDRPGALA